MEGRLSREDKKRITPVGAKVSLHPLAAARHVSRQLLEGQALPHRLADLLLVPLLPGVTGTEGRSETSRVTSGRLAPTSTVEC